MSKELEKNDHRVEEFQKILTARAQEISQGLSAYTACPIYVVYSIDTRAAARCDWDLSTSRKKTADTPGYLINDPYGMDGAEFISEADYEHDRFELLTDEARDIISFFKENNESVDEEYPDAYVEEAQEFYTDRLVAIFLTKEAASAYMEGQKHNIGDGFIYVENAGYRNFQLETLLGR